MAAKTKIEWTDSTWNPITGCKVVSAGCTHCYAMKLAGTRMAEHPSRTGLTTPSHGGPVWNGTVRFNDAWLDEPLRRKRPRRIFVCAHADLFYAAVPDEWIDRVFAVMALAPQHIFQVLTKRPDRMHAYLATDPAGRAAAIHAQMVTLAGPDIPPPALPLPHVWLGVSVENQDAADTRVARLLATPAAVHWVSAEPLLSAVDLTAVRTLADAPDLHMNALAPITGPRLQWVVAGGESGPRARPMHPGWVRVLRDQCARAKVAFLMKQWGDWGPVERGEKTHFTNDGRKLVTRLEMVGVPGYEVGQIYTCGKSRLAIERAINDDYTLAQPLERLGKKATGRLLDGKLHDAYPAALVTGAPA